jgi:predicted phosphodiesterase
MDLGKFSEPILVFGGPYSNLSALRSLREKAEQLSIPADHVICTGDIVAYCGQPWESTEYIQNWGVHVLMGNCEESFAQNSDDCGCGFDEGSACDLLSIEWFRFANSEVTEDQRKWFAQLPRKLTFDIDGRKFECVHGGLDSINQFLFPSTNDQTFAEQFELSQADVILAGHSGIPFSKQVNGKLWHNSGALGMPANDGTTSTWFSVISACNDQIKIETLSLEYDYLDSVECMLEVGLNSGYATCLQNGLWPTMEILPDTERENRGLALAPQVLYF